MSRGSIIKREGKKGVSWLLKYDVGTDPRTGKRKVCYKTIRGPKKDAERELRNLLKQVDDNAHVDPSRLTTGEWFKKWLTDYAKHSVTLKTFKRYEELVAHVLAYREVSDAPIQKLAGHHIQSLYSHLREKGGKGGKGLSERTIHHVHRRIHSALSTAVKQRLITRNPLEDVATPKPADSAVRHLNPDQLRTLLNGLRNHHLYALVILGAGTGMRLGEMLGLRWSDLVIDSDKPKLRVERSVEETTHPHSLQIKTPKSKKGRRQIALSANVVSVLRGHWKRQAETALKCGVRLRGDSLVFPAFALAIYQKGREIDPYALASPRLISAQFKKAAKAAGVDLPPRNAVHVLRHTHATQLLDQGVNPKIVSERLGHAKVAITLDIYAHAVPDTQERAAEVAGGLLDQAMADG